MSMTYFCHVRSGAVWLIADHSLNRDLNLSLTAVQSQQKLTVSCSTFSLLPVQYDKSQFFRMLQVHPAIDTQRRLRRPAVSSAGMTLDTTNMGWVSAAPVSRLGANSIRTKPEPAGGLSAP